MRNYGGDSAQKRCGFEKRPGIWRVVTREDGLLWRTDSLEISSEDRSEWGIPCTCPSPQRRVIVLEGAGTSFRGNRYASV